MQLGKACGPFCLPCASPSDHSDALLTVILHRMPPLSACFLVMQQAERHMLGAGERHRRWGPATMSSSRPPGTCIPISAGPAPPQAYRLESHSSMAPSAGRTAWRSSSPPCPAAATCRPTSRCGCRQLLPGSVMLHCSQECAGPPHVSAAPPPLSLECLSNGMVLCWCGCVL